MGWRRKKIMEPKSDVESKRGARLLEDLIECCDGKSNPIKFFSGDEILQATDNLCDSNVFGLYDIGYNWYIGKTENHHKLLIKKAARHSDSYGRVDFYRDIAVSSMVSGHKNFLKFAGYCLELESPVMVYHCVKKHYKLHDLSEQSWKRRMKIAEDIATALAYLHTALPRPFVYTNLSLENILVDEDGVAKLINFSLCVSIPKGEKYVKVDRAVGLYSYMDYKHLRSDDVSEETDVFAIGILMQTLLTGQERIWEFSRVVKKEEKEDEEERKKETKKGDQGDSDSETMSKMNLLSYQRTFLQNWQSKVEDQRMEETTDPEMLEKMDKISREKLCQKKAFRMLSLRCMGHAGEVPTMVEVAKELRKIQRSQLNSPQDICSLLVHADPN